MKTLIALAAALLAVSAVAAPGMYHDPARDGYGLSIGTGATGYPVYWYLYRPDGSSAMLVGGELCEAFPCVLALHEPTAQWMGGDPDLGPEVGEIEIGVGNPLPVRYDLRVWQPERCIGISPGGTIFRECAGRLELHLLHD